MREYPPQTMREMLIPFLQWHYLVVAPDGIAESEYETEETDYQREMNLADDWSAWYGQDS